MRSSTVHRGSLIRLRPEYEERYIILHKNTFRDVLKRIRISNIRNYSIFLLDGVLFSYLEYAGKNYASDMKAMAKDKTTEEWWKLTDPMQEPFRSRKKGEWWANLGLISHYHSAGNSSNRSRRFCFTAEIIPGTEQSIRELFKEFDVILVPPSKKAHIHTQSVFLGLKRMCVYFEYNGKDFAEDDKKLNSLPFAQSWNNELERCLRGRWREMKEVFHTT